MIRKSNLSRQDNFSVLYVFLFVFLYGSGTLQAQQKSQVAVMGEIIRLDSAIDSLLAPDAQIEVVAIGFTWIEGPVWFPEKEHPQGGYLLFSEIPKNRVLRWDEKTGIDTWLSPSGYTGRIDYGAEPGSNGLLVDRKGQLISCEHGDRRISVLTDGGGKRTLADNYQGKRFNSPNDACFGPDGETIYFTDPAYGLRGKWDDPSREMDYAGIFRLAPDGVVTLLNKEMTRPNGIAFSPDFLTLYVAQSDPEAAIIRSFSVQKDGTLDTGTLFYDATEMSKTGLKGLPDGLKVDRAGNLWTSGPDGVHILTPQGKLLGRISVGGVVSNCAWGNDGSVLYLTARNYLCRIRTLTKGAGWDNSESK